MEYLRRKLCLLAGSILLTCAAWGQTLPTDSITKDPEAWYIHFKTGKSNLDLDYNGNRGTLQRCIDRVQEIIDKNEYVIDHIRIIGYASPEGPLTLNLRLSAARADVLKDYLVAKTGLSSNLFEVVAGDIKMNEITITLQADHLILEALKEDISSEDVTTNSVMKDYVKGEVELICKQDGVIAGLEVYRRVFELLDADTKTELYCKDGDEVKNGQLMGKVTGDIRVLLSGERVALNYLQRMSGIATYTHSVAGLLEGSKTKLLDTRKTTPNMRIFEKYAVRVGGGYNHRYNLSDGVLLKDNHIGAAGSVKKAVEMAKDYAPFVRKIEVEVENLEMVKEAVEAGADIIMLDNMSTEEMQEAIKIIDGRAETECSGNVTKENIGRLTALGVDYISSGALTHSAPILDISMKNLHAVE